MNRNQAKDRLQQVEERINRYKRREERPPLALIRERQRLEIKNRPRPH
jgi:hypothetical protein